MCVVWIVRSTGLAVVVAALFLAVGWGVGLDEAYAQGEAPESPPADDNTPVEPPYEPEPESSPPPNPVDGDSLGSRPIPWVSSPGLLEDDTLPTRDDEGELRSPVYDTPPPAPSGVSVTLDSRTGNAVNLEVSWSAVFGASRYRVERRIDSEAWITLGHTTATTLSEHNAPCIEARDFRVYAFGDGILWEVDWSDASDTESWTPTDCDPPVEPPNVTVNGGSVTLTWDADDELVYRVDQWVIGSTWDVLDDNVTGGTYTIEDLCKRTHYFRLWAKGDGSPYTATWTGPSDHSPATVTIDCPPVPPPSYVNATATVTSVTLDWGHPTDVALDDLVFYRIDQLQGDGTWKVIAYTQRTVTSYTHSGLTHDTAYRYRVGARGDMYPYLDEYEEFTEAGTSTLQQMLSISRGSSPVTEGNDTVFTVTASPAPESDLTVHFTATDDGDYISGTPAASVEILANSTQATLPIPTDDDNVDEMDGSVTVTLVDDDSYTPKPPQNTATVVVEDNDVPKLRVESSHQTITEGGLVTFTVTADIAPAKELSVLLNVTLDGDFFVPGLTYGPVTIRSGQRTGSVQVPTLGDSVDEVDGSANVTLLGGDGYTTMAPTNSDTVLVLDDDVPELTITSTQTSVTEGQSIIFTVTADIAPATALTVPLNVTQLGDFLFPGLTYGPLTIPAHQTTVVGPQIPTVDDTRDEEDGSATIALLGGSGYTLGHPDDVTVPVRDDDVPQITIERAQTSVEEGATIAFTVKASPVPAMALRVNLNVTEVGDFILGNPPPFVTIGAGASAATLLVPTDNDLVVEDDGSVTATLATNGDSYTLGSPVTGTVEVTDNDKPTVTVSAVPDTLVEGGIITFTVEIAAGVILESDLTVYLDVTQVGDFIQGSVPSNVTIEEGDHSYSFQVRTEADTVDEASGLVSAAIESHSSYRVGTPGSASVTVFDTPQVTITASPGSLTEGGIITFTVAADYALLEPLPVNVDVTEVGDFTDGTLPTEVTIPLGSASMDFSVPTEADAVDEAHGSVSAALQVGAGYIVGHPGDASVTVLDAPRVTIGADHDTLTEGGVVTFTVTTDYAPPSDLDVDVHVTQVGDFLVGTPPSSVRIPANHRSATLTLATRLDDVDEADGSISVALQGRNGYVVDSPGTATATVLDSPRVSVTSASQSVTEGDDVAFTVTVDSAFPSDIVVSVEVTQQGNYLQGASPSMVTIPANTTSAILTIPTTDDRDDELDGSISVTLQAATGYVVESPNSATVAVEDDDVPSVTITASPSPVTEGGTITFTVTTAPVPASDLTVELLVTDTPTGAFLDAAGAMQATILAGQAVALLNVTTVGDDVDEIDGVVTGAITSGSGYEIGAPAEAEAAVLDDDLPILAIAARTSPVAEGENAVFILTREGATADTFTVSVHVSETGAMIGVPPPTSVTFLAGASSAELAVDTLDDGVGEVDSVITVQIQSSATYDIEANSDSASVGVTDNDLPRLSIQAGDTPLEEGETAVFTLTREQVTTGSLTVAVRVSETGDMAANALPTSVTFLPGSGTATLSIPTDDDAVGEAGSILTVEIQASATYNIEPGAGAAQVRVEDNDLPSLTIAAVASPVTEGEDARFIVSSSLPPTSDLTVGVELVDVPAGAFLDTTGAVQITILAGQASAQIHAPTIDDDLDEVDGLARASILSGSGYGLGATSLAEVSVEDNDLPIVMITPGNSPVEEGENAVFTLERVGVTTHSLEVPLSATESGAMVSGLLPSSATFQAGSATAQLVVATTDDAVGEADSVLTIAIDQNAAYRVKADARVARVTVEDNDLPRVSITAGTSPVMEGYPALFTLRRTGDHTDSLTVSVRVSESGATLLAPIPTSVTFQEGSATAELPIPTANDAEAEADSVVTVEIGMGTGYDAETGSESAQVTVGDDDRALVSIVPGSVSFEEGEGVRFTIERTKLTPPRLRVYVSVSESGTMIDGAPPTSVRFRRGATTAHVNIPTLDDAAGEPDSVVTVSVDPGADYLIERDASSATARVEDNDLPRLAITAGVLVIEEGDNVVATLTRRGSAADALTVHLSVTESGAMLSDIPPTSVTLPAGNTSTNISISTLDDSVGEADSVVTVAIGLRADYNVEDDAGSVEISVQDNEQPRVAITADRSPVGEGESVSFTLRRDGSTTGSLTVGLHVGESGEVLSGTLPTSVTFQAGSATATLFVPTSDDGAGESDSLVTAEIGVGPGYNIEAGAGSAQVTVEDDDPPTVGIGVVVSSVDEGGDAKFTIWRAGGLAADLVVDLEVTESGDMISGTSPSSVTIPANQTSVVLSVGTTDDFDDWPHSVITVAILANTSYSISSSATAEVTVTDNDLPYVYVIANTPPVVEEGQGATYTIARSTRNPLELTLQLDVAEVGEVAAGVLPDSLTLSATDAQVILTIPTDDDTLDEEDGSITVSISPSPEYYVIDGGYTVTVEDNDLPTVAIEAVALAEEEGEALRFTLTRVGVTTASLTVNVDVTESGSMVSGAPPTSVTFQAGSDTAELQILTSDDTATESDSVVTVEIGAGSRYVVDATSGSVQVTAEDNDQPTVSITAGTSPIEEGESAMFTIERKRVTTGSLTVRVSVTESGDMISGTPPPTVVFLAGSAMVQLLIPTSDDPLVESDSVVAVTIDAGIDYDVDPDSGSAQVTVEDNDFPIVSIATEASRVDEGQDAAFTLTRTGPTTDALTVAIAVSETGDMIRGAGPTSITFLAGSDTAALPIPTSDDELDEVDSLVTAAIATGPGYGVDANSSAAQVTVEDNDLPTVSIAAVASPVEEGEDARFTLTRTGPATDALTVAVTVSETGDMISSASPTSVAFPVGSDTAELSIPTSDDATAEIDSVVTVQVDASANYDTDVNAASAQVTVTDDEAPIVSIAAVASPVEEGEDAEFTLTRTGPTADALTVAVTVSETGDMISGAAPVSVVFQAGVATAVLPVATADDALDEVDSVVTAQVDTTPDYAIDVGFGSAEVRVEDNDLPTVAIAAAASPVEEGEDARFTLTRDGVTTDPLTVAVNVTEGGAVIAGAPPTTVTFQAGSATAELAIGTSDDATAEADSVVTVRLDTGADYDIDASAGSAQVTVADNELPVVSFSVRSSTIEEGEAAVFTFTRRGTSIEALDVNVTIVPVGDFLSETPPTTVTFAKGDATAELTIETVDDAADEAHGRVAATLLQGSTYNVEGSLLVLVTIEDDDLPIVAIVAGSSPVDEGDDVVFTLQRQGDTTGSLTVALTVAETGAMANSPLPTSVTFPANVATVELTIGTSDDVTAEPDSVVTVQVDTSADYDIDPSAGSAQMTVMDNELPVVSFSVRSSSIEEGETAVFTFTRRGTTNEALDVNVSVVPVGDFVSETPPTTVTFAKGDATAELTIETVDDTVDEIDGRVAATLLQGSTYNVEGSLLLLVTVEDNDLPSVTIAAAASPVDEGDDVVFTLTRQGLTAGPLTVTVRMTESGDMLNSVGNVSVTFEAGDATVQLAAGTDEDALDETDSVVTATVAEATNYEVGAPSAAQATVADDDLPVVSIAGDSSSIEEGASVSFTVTREGLLSDSLEVKVGVTETGAMLTGTTPTSVVIPANSNKATFTVSTADDAVAEDDSEVTAEVMASAAYEIASNAGSATVTAVDNDRTVVTIAAGDSPVSEGDNAVFAVTREGDTSTPLSVNLGVGETGAMISGSPPTSVTILAGETTATVTIATEEDHLDEVDSVITVELEAGGGYRLGSAASADVTVADDDLPVLNITLVGSSPIEEGEDAVFTVTRAGVITEALTIVVSVVETGAMISGPAPTSLEFAAGSASQSLVIPTDDDAVDEPNSTIFVSVTLPNDLSRNSPIAFVEVTDND